VISSGLIILLATFFDLSQIAAIGALSMLIIHLTVHVGHLRLLHKTGASFAIIVLAVLANAGAIGLGAYHIAGTSPLLLVWICGFFLLALVTELLLHRLADRTVTTRAEMPDPMGASEGWNAHRNDEERRT
jgi:hypothetical protein